MHDQHAGGQRVHDLFDLETPLHREIARLIQALAAVDTGDFFGAYTETEIAEMRTRLQRLRRQRVERDAEGSA
jgi:hypothetical protein